VLHVEALALRPLSKTFPELLTVPDPLELWLRRLPKLALRRDQLTRCAFRYHAGRETVTLVSDRAADLSLAEAWEIEDALSGYAARVYGAVRATAQALVQADGGFVQAVKSHSTPWAGPPASRAFAPR
jgi:hypothetical protein